MSLCLEFAQELQDEQGRSTGQGGQVIDDRDAVGRCVHQGCDDALTGVSSVRDDGVDDRPEPSVRARQARGSAARLRRRKSRSAAFWVRAIAAS
jgi:hypothetical protein